MYSIYEFTLDKHLILIIKNIEIYYVFTIIM